MAASRSTRPTWQVRLGQRAEQDYVEILRWTALTFGAAEARRYAVTLDRALLALQKGPAVAGARARDDIQPGIRTLHVARGGRKGRHFLVFRVSEENGLDILRVLHDRMDLARHVPAGENPPH
jgi:toxin ParE1/3/4